MGAIGYLTIPDYPRYEINARLEVRDKETGRRLKGSKRGRGVYVKLSTPTGKANRSANVLYRQAFADAEKVKWLAIPSLGGKYELDYAGAVRHAKTKRVVKARRKGDSIYYILSDGEKRVIRLWSELMNEVNGTAIKRRKRAIGIQLARGGEYRHFESLAACARFLSEREYYTAGWIQVQLGRRPAEIYGWAAKYY